MKPTIKGAQGIWVKSISQSCQPWHQCLILIHNQTSDFRVLTLLWKNLTGFPHSLMTQTNGLATSSSFLNHYIETVKDREAQLLQSVGLLRVRHNLVTQAEINPVYPSLYSSHSSLQLGDMVCRLWLGSLWSVKIFILSSGTEAVLSMFGSSQIWQVCFLGLKPNMAGTKTSIFKFAIVFLLLKVESGPWNGWNKDIFILILWVTFAF